jgi:hypothetical protein
MNEPRDEAFGWWLLAVLGAVVLGWWLAIRTMALRIGAVATATLTGVDVPTEKVVRPKLTLEQRSEDYLTVKELEEHLPLCGKSIRAEIRDGRLPSHRLRGKVTVKGSDALAWLSARREA